MKLISDIKFNSDKLMELITKFQNSVHVEELHGFTEESLDTLDRDDLIKSITKSFGVDIERVEAILKKSLDTNALVKLAHFAIELANEHVSRADSNKKRKGEGDNQAGQSKKGKTNEPSNDTPLSSGIHIDHDSINERLHELDALLQSTKYSKQKEALKLELISFLNNLNPQTDLSSALPLDIRMFLIFKDGKGKTQVHKSGCSSMGNTKKCDKSCECPFRRSAGSVDSLIGQLRAIFRDYGRGTDWNNVTGFVNPAAASVIKKTIYQQ